MSMLNKIFVFVIAANLILIQPANADETPKYTNLEQGAPAPFSGTLFNPTATATLITESQFSMSSCDLRVEFETSKVEARYQLQVDMLQASFNSLEEKHNLLMVIKDDEIEVYRTMALDQPNKNNHWWLAGGMVTGIGVTLGVLFASKEIQN